MGFSFFSLVFLFLFLVMELFVLTATSSFDKWETRGFWGTGAKVYLAAAEDLSSVDSKVVLADSRPLLIRNYLEKYHSPLLPYSQKIFDLSQKYGFDYRWIPAVAQQESNLCKKIPENSYNCWGYGIHSRGTLRFASYDEALESYAAYLRREYFDKGLLTPEEVMGKYAPFSPGSWASGVRQFMKEIEDGV